MVSQKRQTQVQRAAMARRAAEAAKANANQNGDSPMPDIKEEVMAKQTLLPWELVDELMSNLKTNYPLLALTMEKMVDQISFRAKPSSEEDIYRFFAALLADALQVCVARLLDRGADAVSAMEWKGGYAE
jgi:transformation/transcription domain-associated protein